MTIWKETVSVCKCLCNQTIRKFTFINYIRSYGLLQTQYITMQYYTCGHNDRTILLFSILFIFHEEHNEQASD